MDISTIDFEGLIRDLYVRVLKPGDLAIDCGAHHGGHTFQMAQAVMPSGKVLAIEASTQCADHMRHLLEGPYRHLAGAVELHCIGLAAQPGESMFYYAPEAPGLSGLRQRNGTISTPLEAYPVILTTLDLLCGQIQDPIRFIKIDVEGAEYEVLRGGTGTIRRHRPLITFEHNADSPRHFGYNPAAIMNLFDELDYRVTDHFGNRYSTLERAAVWDFIATPCE
jgi:FkbM family methyltransferase